MKTEGVELAWIVVKDLDGAIAFYRDVAGLELKERNDQFGWAELAGPKGAVLGLAAAASETEVAPGSNAVFTISVSDLDAALAHFKAKGADLVGNVIEIPGHVRLQTVKDRDGNRLQLVQKF